MAGMYDPTVENLIAVGLETISGAAVRSIFRINPDNPSDQNDPYGRLLTGTVPQFLGDRCTYRASDNLLYVSNSSTFNSYDLSNGTEVSGTLPVTISGFTFNDDDDIVAYRAVIGRSDLYLFNPSNLSDQSGKYGLLRSAAARDSARGLATDSNGDLFAPLDHRALALVQKLDPDNNYSQISTFTLPNAFWGSSLGPYDIAINSSDNIFIINSDGNLWQFDSELSLDSAQSLGALPSGGDTQIRGVQGLTFTIPSADPGPGPTPEPPVRTAFTSQAAWFLQMGPDSTGTTQRLTSWRSPVTYDSETWQPTNSAIVGDVVFDGSPPKVEIALALSSREQRNQWLAFTGSVDAEFGYIQNTDSGWEQLGHRVVGKIRDPEVTADYVMVTVDANRILVPETRTWTDTEQRARDSLDHGLSQLRQVASSKITWPRG